MPRLFAVLALICLSSAPAAGTAHANDGPYPSYQRNRNAWTPGYEHSPRRQYSTRGSVPHAGNNGNHHGGNHNSTRRGDHNGPRRQHPSAGYAAPQVSGGSFQRAYPYHLDYYRMRWGGSYAPYFGNLYGPPDVVLGAPPYYGGGYYNNGYYNGSYLNGGPTAVPYQAPYEVPNQVAP